MKYLGRSRVRSINHITVSFETLCKLLVLPLWLSKRITEEEFYSVYESLPARAKHDHPKYMINLWGEWLAKKNKQAYMSREDFDLVCKHQSFDVPDDVKNVMAMFGMSAQHILKMFSVAADMSYLEYPFERYWELWLLDSDIQFTVKPSRCEIHFDRPFGERISHTNNKMKIPS